MNLGGNPKLDALNAGMERVMAEKAAARSALVGAVEPSLFESVPPWDKAVGDDVDPWDTPLPAPTDTRGRILSPVVRDEFIDLP